MKGIVFRQFIQLVEERFGLELADELLTRADLPSGGVYTSVGTYDPQEIVQLVTLLSQAAAIPVPQLLRELGECLFEKLAASYPDFLRQPRSGFEMLESVDQTIHVEVRKLYPDAELPAFSTQRLGGDTLRMDYRSPRPFADLAEGLIRGCFRHFNESIDVRREDDADRPGYAATFTLTRKAA